MNLNELAREIRAENREKGFVMPPNIGTVKNVERTLARIALIHTELAEMTEAARKMDWENFQEETADTLIRLLDLAGGMDVNLDEEVARKRGYNKTRPDLHGKVI